MSLQVFPCSAHFFLLLGELKKGLRLFWEREEREGSHWRRQKHSAPVQSRKDRAYVGRRPLQDSRSSQWSSQAVSYVASWAEKTAKNRLEHTDTAGFFRAEILGFSVLSSRAYRDEEKLQYKVKIATLLMRMSVYTDEPRCQSHG